MPKKMKQVSSSKGSTTPTSKGELCHCGCGEVVNPGKRFRRGHDARFHGRIKRLSSGELKLTHLPSMGVGDYAIRYYKDGMKTTKAE